MDLIIVESPTKARTLSRFLGTGYRIAATMGHLRDLPAKKLGVEVEKGFEPEYVAVAGKRKTITELKDLAGQARKIYLATDPDREGEAIAYHALKVINEGEKTKTKKEKFARISFHEITQRAIERALDKPGKINMPLVNAQQARRILDRLVGYKLSPLLWRKIRRGLSAGRVQSVTVELVVEREREIEAFKPEEYWEIFAELTKKKPGDRSFFSAKLTKQNGKTLKIGNGQTAKKVSAELEKAVYRAVTVEKKEVEQSPVPPFTTSTLQQAAARQLRFTSKRTMQVAQRLYENGLITYHRTDSVALSAEAVTRMRDFIGRNFGRTFLPEKPRFFKTKAKVAQEAHEAIRPTDVAVKGQNLKSKTRDEERLYDLIWKRAVASQMSSAVWDQTKIGVGARGKSNEYELLAEGKTVKFEGWLRLYGGAAKTADKTGADTKTLPEVNEGEELNLVKLDSQQKFTQPPARYSEATLIKELEKRGIGRPSTYAPTISTIQTRQYVEKEEGRFKPTLLGITVNDFLVKYFPKVMDYDFTAKMEDDLDGIAKGEQEWGPVLEEFYGPFAEKLDEVGVKAKRAKIPVEKTDKACPECQKGLLIIRSGRFGKFLACERFPECKYTAPYVPVLKGVKCEKCGGKVVVKKTKKGKQFYGCGNYPKCDWASWRKPK